MFQKKFSRVARALAFLANHPSSNRVHGVNPLKEETKMSRRRTNVVLPILVALLLAMPLAARGGGSKTTKPTSATLDVLAPVSLGGKQLKPGTYVITAGDTKVTLALDGKVMAEAPALWKDETSKPKYTNLVAAGDQVKEIHFSGKMRYVEIAE